MTADFPLAFFLQPVLAADIGLSLLQLLLFFVSLWLIFLILIQRGKGGGLTAAFGGGGGDSAFGAKAGDAFTKITIVSALVWITLCMVTIAAYNPPEQAENPYAQNDKLPADKQPSAGGASMSGGLDAAADKAAEAGADLGSSSSDTDGDAAPADGGSSESGATEGDAGADVTEGESGSGE